MAGDDASVVLGTAAPLAAAVREVATAAPLWLEPGDTVRQAARAMDAAGAGSVLVSTEPPGIVTDRDLRSRVLARGLPPDTPVARVMSRPLLSVDADATVFEAYLTLLEAGVHHLAVAEEGEVVAVVSSTDLQRHHGAGPFWVLHHLERDPDLDHLADYGRHVTRTVRALRAGGLGALAVARLVASLNDHLTRRVLARATAELGPAPAPWAWLALGAEGRREQTLLTDQDNALVHAGDTEADGEYFHELARRAGEARRLAGFPPCAEGYVADRWCAPLDEWLRRFRHWLDETEAEALLGAAVFFDLRRVDGELDLEPLDAVLEEAGSRRPFLHHLLRSTRPTRGPVDLLGRPRVDGEGGLDVKNAGLMPLASLARVAGLAADARRRSTAGRLSSAAASGLLEHDEAEVLAGIYDRLLDLRLDHQLRQLAAGRPSDHRLSPAELEPAGRRRLADDLRAVQRARRALERRLG